MFRGDVIRPSHEGGLLISFTGSSPALGTTLETDSGIRLGKVDTVLGSIHKPWVHVFPISKGLDIVSILGKSTIISNKRTSQKPKVRKEDRDSKYSRNNRRERKIFNDNDWICTKCKNDNFSWRERCNKCSAPKEDRKKPRNNSWNKQKKDFGRSGRHNRSRDSPRTERRNWNKNEGRYKPSNNKNIIKSNSIRRIKGKSRSHFKNRELDDIFKKRSK